MALVSDTFDATGDTFLPEDHTCHACGEQQAVVVWHGMSHATAESKSNLMLCIPCTLTVCGGLLNDLVLGRFMKLIDIYSNLVSRLRRTAQLRVQKGFEPTRHEAVLNELEES